MISRGGDVGRVEGGGGAARWRQWAAATGGKFTATSRVAKGKIDGTDTRRAECGLGTAIQVHCSDHLSAALMALTARGRRRAGIPPPLAATAPQRPYGNHMKCPPYFKKKKKKISHSHIEMSLARVLRRFSALPTGSVLLGGLPAVARSYTVPICC